jgi:hypothetical protein
MTPQSSFLPQSKCCDTFWIGDEYGALEVAMFIVDADGG